MPKLTLLMITTPPDFEIAKYSLRALKKHARSLPDCSLLVYQNGLSQEQEREISSIIYRTGWCSVSNRTRLRDSVRDMRVGELFRNEQGAMERREGYYETCGEIWSRELVRLDSPLVGIIDADFEIFDPSFIPEMVTAFADDDKLAIFATEHSHTQELFESYSRTMAFLMERWHTWFCIYRKTALEENHDFSYKELRDETSGLPMKFDHSAWLQKLMIERGWRGRASERSHEWKYMHYGAFAKNKTLSGAKLAVYRTFRILRHNGLQHLHRSEFVAKQLRRIGRRAYRWLGFEVYDDQRLRYIFEQE